MTKKNDTSENDKAMQYEPVLYPVFNEFNVDDWDEEDEEEIEPYGYECMGCGNIQDKSTGFGCNICSGPMKEWYS